MIFYLEELSFNINVGLAQLEMIGFHFFWGGYEEGWVSVCNIIPQGGKRAEDMEDSLSL